MKRNKSISVKEVVPGQKYSFSGDIQNGHYADGTPCISHEEVVRKVSYINGDLIVCQCGRRFIINENLKISKI